MADEAEDVPSIEAFRKRLEAEAAKSVEPDPEPEPVPEPEMEPLESGRLVVEFKRSIIHRDAKGRITDIISDVSHRIVRRNENGAVIAIDEVIEREELE